MTRQDFHFLPNRPSLFGELRSEFTWPLCHIDPCGEPTLDAPENIARGSAIGFLSDSGKVITQGHVSRPGWRAKTGGAA